MSKTLQTRVQLKHDTEANWNTASINGFIPLVGEIIIYDQDDNNFPRMKIGDGKSLINDLPFSPISPERIDEFGNGYRIDVGLIQVWDEYSGLELQPSCFYAYDNESGRYNEINNTHILLSDGSGNEIYITANGEMVTGDTCEGGKTLFIDNAIISGVADPYDDNDAVNKKYVDDENNLKMDKVNPTGTGSFSLNRTEDSDIGEYSFAEGYMTVASGIASHAEGGPFLDDDGTALSIEVSLSEDAEPIVVYGPNAIGNMSHAEGRASYALGDASHAENGGFAIGENSHAENVGWALGEASHAEGYGASSGYASHAEGSGSSIGENSHAEGYGISEGDASHAESGGWTIGEYSHAEGNGVAYNYGAHAEEIMEEYWPIDIEVSGRRYQYTVNDFESVKDNIQVGGLVFETITEKSAIITYIDNTNGVIQLDAPIFDNDVTNAYITVYRTGATGIGSHSEGMDNLAAGEASHAEGLQTIASGYVSHSEGGYTIAKGYYSHAEGENSYTEGEGSHAEGEYTKATGAGSHSEGAQTKAKGDYSHAEGQWAEAKGSSSHAEGGFSYAEGQASHAEGYYTQAIAKYSHAEGSHTTASSESQHAQGKYNIVDENNTYAHIVGNGATEHTRSNAHTLDWDGNGWFAGDVYIGSTSGTNKDDGSKKLATEEYVDSITPAFTVVGTTLVVGNAASIPVAEDYSF